MSTFRAQMRSVLSVQQLIQSTRRAFSYAYPGGFALSADEAASAMPPQLESQTNQAPPSPPSQSDASPPNISLENPPSSVFGTTKLEQQLLTKVFEQVRDPLQAEWEHLWFYGAAGSFSKIANHFPNVQLLNPATVDFQSISEPSLDVSKLEQEHRAVFESEESVRPSNFAPTDETDRLHREQRARGAHNDQERFALLLGLPTYEEYVANQVQKCTEGLEIESTQPSKRQIKKQARIVRDKERRKVARTHISTNVEREDEGYFSTRSRIEKTVETGNVNNRTEGQVLEAVMSPEKSKRVSAEQRPTSPAEHRPLVVGLTKPKTNRSSQDMASPQQIETVEKEMAQNASSNVDAAAPSQDIPTAPPPTPPPTQPSQKKEKKEKGPKQPKQHKGGAAVPPAPTTPALIDLRVGHILRAIVHPNADSLYVSTIAMGDPEGTEHTQVDEETGKVVRTVCSGLNGLVPLEEMQNRKIIVVANLKPVNMRSIKSAAMVLAASPKQEEGADPHAPDRVVELVLPPEGSEAGDKVYFEGWEYGEGKGPEKQLNPKKKQWEAIQPGFYTSDDLIVGFDASRCEEVEGDTNGNLVVEGKGKCTVKTLKGAVVR